MISPVSWNWVVYGWDWSKWATWHAHWEYVDQEPEMTSAQGAD